MSEQEHGRSTTSDPSPGIGLCTSSDYPVTADNGSATTTDESSTFNDLSTSVFLSLTAYSSATTSNGSTAALQSSTTDRSAIDSSLSTIDSSASATPGGSATAHNGSATARDCSATKRRVRFTARQLNRLEKEYIYSHRLNRERRAEIAAAVQLGEFQVQHWFKRRKKQQKVAEEKEAMDRNACEPLVLPSNSGLPSAPEMTRVQHSPQSGHQLPVGAFGERRLGEQPFILNFYVPIEQFADEASRQQLPDARSAKIDRPRSPGNADPRSDPDRPVGRDRSRPPGKSYPSHNPVPGQEIEVKDVLRENVRNIHAATRPRGYYEPMVEFLDGVPPQQLSDARPASRDRSRSPVNPEPSPDPVPGQVVEVGTDAQDKVSYPNAQWYTHPSDAQLTRRDRPRSAVDLDPSLDPDPVQKIEVKDVLRDNVFNLHATTWSRGYYEPMTQFPDGVPLQQLPNARLARRDLSRSPVNPEESHDPVPEQIVEVRTDAQDEVPFGWDIGTELAHSINVIANPHWYPHPSDARLARRDRSRSPVNPDPSHDPVPRLETEVTADVQRDVPHGGDTRKELMRNLHVTTNPQWSKHPY